MAETTLKQKTAKGLFWGGLSSGIQQFVSLGFGIFAARTLSDGDYGLVAMLGIFSGIALIIMNCGFSIALTNKQNATDEDYNAVFWFSVFTGLILYIVLFFSAPLIAWYYNEPALIDLSRVSFISLPLSSLGIVPFTILFKHLKIKQQALVDILSLFVSCSVGIVMILNGYRYWSLAVQGVVFLSLCAILRLIIVPWKPHFKINFAPLKPFFSFSVKLFLTSLFQQINTYIFSVILGKYYGKNVLGQFDRGQSWVVRGNNFIIGMINYVTQPVLAQINENKERQVNVLRKLIRFGAFVSFPLMLGLAFVGEEFIVITIGEKWLPSVPILQLFCISGAIGFIVTLFSNLIYTQGKSGLYMNITVIIGTIQILAALCLLPFGIKSMLSGYIAVYLAGLFVWHHYVYKLLGLRLTAVLKDILPYLVITLICFAITWFLTKKIENKIALLGSKIVVSGIFYIFALKISRSTIFKESMGFLSMLIYKK